MRRRRRRCRCHDDAWERARHGAGRQHGDPGTGRLVPGDGGAFLRHDDRRGRARTRRDPRRHRRRRGAGARRVAGGLHRFAFLETGFGPWAEPLVEGEPERLDAIDLNLEAIAALDPDLIIGVSNGFDEAMYAQLSQIAPTIGRPVGTEAYQVARPDATAIIATALGRADAGTELETATAAAYAAAIAEHPEFAGLTAVVAQPYDGVYGVSASGDGRAQLMAGLGMELPPTLQALDTGAEFSIELSPEQVALLDCDVLVMLADSPELRAVVEGDAVLQAVPVVAEGRMVIPDTDTRGAMTSNTVLSIPYALDHLVPLLADAVAAS